jgi:anti-sigma factor RsiW
MSDCRGITARLTAYADGMLEPAEREGIDRHLSACPPCRSLADAERHGRAIVRHRASQLLNEPLPPGLRGRCEALAAAPGVPGPWWRIRLVPALLMTVVMIFAASAILSLATRRSDGLLAAQLTADHSKCFRLFAPPDGTSAEARRVEQMLSDEYGWTVHVPPSSAEEGIQLAGARRCLYGEGLIPHLMYRVHGQDVSLFVLEGTSRPAADLVALGHRSQVWSREGTTFVMVSPVNAGGMARAARYVMGEAR